MLINLFYLTSFNSCRDEYIEGFLTQSIRSIAIHNFSEKSMNDSHEINFQQALRYHFNEKPENNTCGECGHPNLLVKYRYHNGIPR